ncbi:MAG: DUF177 domain-containing protein [Acetobacteraceae bacterium]|nr:DUF177 domain-containing protein [Acetobacteraceae bacterium]
MTPELHRPIAAERIGPEAQEFIVEATPAECRLLAVRMNLPAIESLVCRFALRREGGAMIHATGTLLARVVQTCIVSLDDFAADVQEEFSVWFVPEGRESEEIDPEADDEIPYTGGVIDLGEAAAEQLGLALDPYPRKPYAVMPEIEEAEEPHPFAALAALRRGAGSA